MERAKRSGSDKRKRARLLQIRLSDAEYNRIAAHAESVGVAAAAYARMQLLDAPPPRASRKPPANKEAIARLLGQIGKLGGNVHQIVRRLNVGIGVPAERIDEALAAVADMRAACMEALGRKP